MHSDNKDIYCTPCFLFLQLIMMYGLLHVIIHFLGVLGGVHVRSHALHAEA